MRLGRAIYFIFVALTFATQSARADRILRYPIYSEPESLDPQQTTGAQEWAIIRHMFIGLLSLDPHGRAVPGIAESWDISGDGKLWTFHLRNDAKWSNGDPITSEDFVYSFRRLVDPESGTAGSPDLFEVTNAISIATGKEKDITKLGVDAPDAHTFRIFFVNPRTIMPLLLTDPMLVPLHRATIERWGNKWTRPENIVSDGPYIMTSWVPQSGITMIRNPYFYDLNAVSISQVNFVEVEQSSVELKQFRAGELDWAHLTPATIEWARQNGHDDFHSVPSNGYSFLFFNMTSGVLAHDIRIRQALAMSINREVLIEKVAPLGQAAAYGILPPVITGYTRQEMLFKNQSMNERIDRAKKLIYKAGYSDKNPLSVNIIYPRNPEIYRVLFAISKMWEEIGVKTTLEDMEWQALLGRKKSQNFEIGYVSGLGNYDDPEPALENFRSDAGNYNYGGYKNQKFDVLFQEAMSATDIELHRQILSRCERMVLDDYPVIPLWYLQNNWMVVPQLKGWDFASIFPQARYLSFSQVEKQALNP